MDHETNLLQEPEKQAKPLAYRSGDVIVEAGDPFIKFLQSSCRGSHCYYCLKRPQKLRPCKQCFVVGYCDIHCQTKDWDNNHRLECHSPTFRYCGQSWAHNDQLILMRLYTFLIINPEKLVALYLLYDGTHKCFNDLHVNEQAWVSIEYVQNVCADLARRLQVENWKVKTMDFIRLFGIFKLNSFPISIGDRKVGSGIYLPLSALDHACRPNAQCYEVDGRFTVRALFNIPAGEQPNISYLQIPNNFDVAVRRDLLWSQYCIICHCGLCKAEDGQLLNLEKVNAKLCAKTEYATFDQPFFSYDWSTVLAKYQSNLYALRQKYYENDYHITNAITSFAIYAAKHLGKENVYELWEEARYHLLWVYGEHHLVYKSFVRMTFPTRQG